MVTKPTNLNVNLDDLSTILFHIRIAENHVATGVLTNLDGTPIDPLLPIGLRTVDGSFNNLINPKLGAADQVMPRLLTPVFLNDADGDTMPLGPPGSGAPTVTNNDYNLQGTTLNTQGVATGSVADADPRIISNLVSDQTLGNMAAVVKALQLAGSLDPFADASAILAAPAATRQALAESKGLNFSAEGTITILNLSPDIGLSPSFNGWMTIFGQFFDHGLDLIPKGGNGTVYIPLQPGDPLYVVGGPNFMALTRAATVTTAGVDGLMGTADDQTHETINTITPFIDQNQTYTSNASHQVFLREYKMVGGQPASTGHLLDGANGGIGNWAEVKAQALNMLGIQLNDFDVGNVPLLRTDPYGRFIPAANGFAQVIIGVGVDGIANTADDIVAVGTPANPVTTTNALRTGHAFLNDIAHHAAPGKWDHDNNSATARVNQTADTDVLDYNGDGVIDATDLITIAGRGVVVDANNDGVINLLDLADVNLDGAINAADLVANDRNPGTYDNEMLDRHFITGDGRGNENIALTAVHTIFHDEHNRLVEDYKVTILGSGNLAVINEWLLTDLTSVAEIPVNAAGIAALNWDGERLFQAGRFVTEMQYQHLAFEEFARKVQPVVDVFLGISSTIDPSIMAEFAHVVFRFGHSMLTETVDRLDANNAIVDGDPNVAGAQQIGLIAAFLNPVVFDQNSTITAAVAAGQIIRGMTKQVGNEIDEFITEALRNNLVGLPLDLAALNIARGRDTGVPSFNNARAQFFADTGDSRLTPYTGWSDFATHMKTPFSVINFIAAYGTHSSITSIVEGTATTMQQKRDAAMLLVLGGVGAPADRLDFLNGTGTWAGLETGLNAVDFWIGGLAEEKQEFGGMLGATFNFVFERQMESLQAGDRFYYLARLAGMNLLNEMETNSFTNIIMRNTDLGVTGQGHLPGLAFDTPDYILEIVQAVQIGVDPSNGNPIVPLFIRRDVDGDGNSDLLQFNGGQHTVLGGSEENDTLIGGLGNDTLWGDGGNDRLDGGYADDIVHGGNGNDIITNLGGDDFLFGEDGNDVISTGAGIVVAAGGRGSDFIFTGPDVGQIFSGEGNDFILGNIGADFLFGNEGSDWSEGGEGNDEFHGDNGVPVVGGPPIIGHDVLNGQGGNTVYEADAGDDIVVLGPGVQNTDGASGFDWATHRFDPIAANTDLGMPLVVVVNPVDFFDRFISVEALSGWNNNDILNGAKVIDLGDPGENNLLSQNVSLINGLAALLGLTPAAVAALPVNTSIIDTSLGAEVIIGGGGNDTITGNLGNDILDGDAWLNVRIAVADVAGTTSINSLNSIRARLLSGEINPSQLSIVREILQSTTAATDVDTVVFNGNRANYTATLNENGSITIAHTNVVGPNDGVDTVRNFENYKFADGTINQAQLLNIAPVITSDGGAATAAVNVAENSVAVTTVTATDANNVPLVTQTLTYTISALVAANNADAALFTIDSITGALSFVGAPNFEVPTDAGVNGVYNVVVQVSDGISIDTQAIAVTVTNVNEVPVITSNGGADTAATAINENTTAVTTVVAVDPDAGSVLTYSLAGGADSAKFTINASTGALSFITAPDFEIPTDVGGDSIYDVIVQVSDGALGLVDTQAIAVTVNNVVETVDSPPTGALNISSYTANGSAASLTATNTLNDPNGMTGFVQYQWQQLLAGIWTDIAGANTATLANRSNATVRVTSSYTDTFGLNSFVSDQTAIIGTTASSTIAGLAGNDIMLGLAGNDILTASAGNDTIDGGIGTDTYSLSATTAVATINLTTNTSSSAQTGVDILVGIETVIGGAGNDSITDGLGASHLQGGSGNDVFIMTIDNARDILRGNAGIDTIDYSVFLADLTVNLGSTNDVLGSGAAGNLDNINSIQNIISGSGNDSILGDTLVNNINGGGGNDTINGGGGADLLTGGTGADVFIYALTTNSNLGVAGRDVITGFVSDTDKLDFSAMDANTATVLPANEAFTFIGTGAFTAAAQIRFQLIDTDANGSLDSTLVRGNVNAGLGADFEVLLQGVTTAILVTDIIL